MEYKDSRLEKAKDFWTYLEDNRREVATWPTWKRGVSNLKQQRRSDASEGEDGRTANNAD
jgi:hypothetical protein